MSSYLQSRSYLQLTFTYKEKKLGFSFCEETTTLKSRQQGPRLISSATNKTPILGLEERSSLFKRIFKEVHRGTPKYGDHRLKANIF